MYLTKEHEEEGRRIISNVQCFHDMLATKAGTELLAGTETAGPGLEDLTVTPQGFAILMSLYHAQYVWMLGHLDPKEAAREIEGRNEYLEKHPELVKWYIPIPDFRKNLMELLKP